ncbi:unnamed protein product, partial [Didymodactylos carnosus]
LNHDFSTIVSEHELTIKLYNDPDECIDYVTSINNKDNEKDTKIYFIVSDIIGEYLIPLIYQIEQSLIIYIYCQDRLINELKWLSRTQEYNIRGIYNNLHSLFKIIYKDIVVEQYYQQNQFLFNCWNKNETVLCQLSSENGTFMWYQIIIDLLFRLPSTHTSVGLNDLLKYCRQEYKDNQKELNKIQEFEEYYTPDKAIYWYTKDSFLYRLLNKAFRQQNIDHNDENLLIDFYRTELAQRKMPITLCTFGIYLNRMGEYLKARYYFEKLLRENGQDLDCVNMAILYHNIGQTYQSTDEYDKALEYFQKSIQFNMQSSTPSFDLLSILCNGTGLIYLESKKCEQALTYLRKSLAITLKLGDGEKSLLAATLYMNIGNCYTEMLNYTKALQSQEKALEIALSILPEIHPDIASIYEGFSTIYQHQKQYDLARDYNLKSIKIKSKYLHSKHLSLVTAYNNLGTIYGGLEEYDKSIETYEKAIDIHNYHQRPLSKLLSTLYSNVGMVYNKNLQHDKACKCFQKALEIQQAILDHDSLNIGLTYIQLGETHRFLKQNEQAIIYYEMGIKFLPRDHLSISTAYLSIGVCYLSLMNHTDGLKNLKLAYENALRTLPSDHPLIQQLQMNIQILQNK